MPTYFEVRNVQCRDENDNLRTAEVKFECRVSTGDIVDELGTKALRNKSQKAKEVHGGVVVEVVRGIPKGWRMTRR